MENREEQQLASLWKRFVGAMADGIIGCAIVFPIMLKTGVWEKAMRGEASSIGEQATLAILGFAMFLLLHGYPLATRGQTIGKMLVKTKIVDLRGNLVPFWKLVFLRYFLLNVIINVPCVGGLVGLANVLWIFGGQRRCLHDHIAGTKVVDV